MYKQPATVIAAFETEQLLQGFTMSPTGDTGGGGGATEAPMRRGNEID